MPATTYTANLIAKAHAHGTAYQGPDTVYLSLVTTTPTASAAGTEVTLGDYERVATTMSGWDDDAAGVLSNDVDIAYPEATADYDDDVLAVEAWTAATNGTRLWYIVLAAPKVIVTGMTPTFFAGDLVLEVV